MKVTELRQQKRRGRWPRRRRWNAVEAMEVTKVAGKRAAGEACQAENLMQAVTDMRQAVEVEAAAELTEMTEVMLAMGLRKRG